MHPRFWTNDKVEPTQRNVQNVHPPQPSVNAPAQPSFSSPPPAPVPNAPPPLIMQVNSHHFVGSIDVTPIRSLVVTNLDKRMGGGAFGQVFECRLQDTNQLAAVKIIAFPTFGPGVDGKKCVMTEIECHTKAAIPRLDGKHLLVVPILASYVGECFGAIVMPVCESLANYIHRFRKIGGVPDREMRRLARVVAEGAEYLHSLNIIHNDLKPDNILYKINPITKNVDPALADFGLAKQYEAGQVSIRKGGGTTAFLPLERLPGVLCRVPYTPAHARKAESYALGAIIVCMITGVARPSSLWDAKTEWKKVKGRFGNAKSLIDRLLWDDPKGRKTVTKFLEQAWFTDTQLEAQSAPKEERQDGKDKPANRKRKPLAPLSNGAAPAKRHKRNPAALEAKLGGPST